MVGVISHRLLFLLLSWNHNHLHHHHHLHLRPYHHHHHYHHITSFTTTSTGPQTIGAITLTHVVPMTTGCDSATSSAAQQQSSDNAQQTLPCVGYGVCQTSVTSQCSTAASGKRRKRSAGDVLLLLLNVTFDFGTSTQLDDSRWYLLVVSLCWCRVVDGVVVVVIVMVVTWW